MKVPFGQQTTKVKQLADAISKDISLGVYKSGDLLPSINYLSKHHEVSRDTVFKAFIDLKERGFIDSTPGKGYYVTNKLTTILLLLDEYSSFKYELYNSLIKRLSIKYKVDLLFHQYNERLFNTIIRESIGRYNKYLVMNFDNEKFSSNLYKIDESRLLLLDFGKFDKKNYSYICQDFDENFYKGLAALKDRLKRYKKVLLLFDNNTSHPESSKDFFLKFCKDYNIEGAIISNPEKMTIHKGEAYIAIRQSEVVSLIQQGRRLNLKCGRDFGVLAYNDMPSYDVIDVGITSISIDWRAMGDKAAEFVLHNEPIKEYLPTEVHLRNSI